MAENHASSDYETLRNNLYSMLEDAKEALELAKEILKESEHPRAVEVYSGLLKNVATINAQILDLAKTHKDITERKNYKDNTDTLPGQGGQGQIENKPANVYIGSTADLQRMLKEAQDAEVVDVTPVNDDNT
jgi:hypothetical protein